MHEDLLRHIWSKQLFDTSRLITTDGRVMSILNFGALNRGSGPDFRNAKIEIDGIVFNGDIEFHRTFEDWNIHQHHSDPKYNSVILHVVLLGKSDETISQSGRIIPTIILEPFLFASLESISDQLSREEFSSKNNEIPCASKNENIESALLKNAIVSMYRERLQEKVLRLHENLCGIILHRQRAIGEPHPPYNEELDPNDIPLPDSSIDKNLFRRKLPWEQLLYEEIMDGLGYSNNRAPMKKLAENISLITLISQMRLTDKKEYSALQLQTILFKASGLLPEITEMEDQDSKVFVHQLHSVWSELPNKYSISPLHSTEWNFSPTRPSNFPTIRIAAAANILYKILYGSLFKTLITICSGKFSSPNTKIEQINSLFQISDDDFWNYHYSFTEATHKKHTILGESRINDILVNTIIPFVCLYAKVFGKNDLLDHTLNIAAILPLLEDNSILRQMNKQLIKGKIKIESAYQQQGVIQLYKKYCTPNRCNECEIGKIVFKT